MWGGWGGGGACVCARFEVVKGQEIAPWLLRTTIFLGCWNDLDQNPVFWSFLPPVTLLIALQVVFVTIRHETLSNPAHSHGSPGGAVALAAVAFCIVPIPGAGKKLAASW